ncbi:hypothetical protein SteCoe_33085 [Stentor coeruleus]|uniref:DUSP domain-containing protein n=1 Tax=Stentor coeruleus TaxID=5963 RepID=A0A1R2AXI7_9CILI|nr:hypothetical protein SteCoe_33085 [Stentor coeruleus]
MDLSIQKSLTKEAPPIVPESYDSSEKEVMLLSKIWWDKWCAYTGYNQPSTGLNPGPINNHPICTSNPDPDSYICLPKITWKRLIGWYAGGPKRKVFLLDHQLQFDTINISITFQSISTKIISVPLNLKFIDFKDHVCKKFKASQEMWKFYTQFESGIKTKLIESNHTLQDIGFCNNIHVVCERKKNRYQSVMPLDIREEEEEDEEMQKIISYSINDAFDSGRLDIQKDYTDKYAEVDDCYDLKDCNEIKEVKEKVAWALMEEKVSIKLKSLKDLKRNLTHIADRMFSDQ